MKRGETGSFEVTTVRGESVRAFVPRELPNKSLFLYSYVRKEAVLEAPERYWRHLLRETEDPGG